ncbi:hypothetical protein SCACP_07140 [Sporomusa carbonis]|uniref:hypothetical protein n=1 Tax=Sporomusa carbonis TaxID=3076075 RepID=UPI003A5DDE4B
MDDYHNNGLNTHRNATGVEELKIRNRHAADNLVAKMLWGHEENVSLHARVSDNESLGLSDNVH